MSLFEEEKHRSFCNNDFTHFQLYDYTYYTVFKTIACFKVMTT